MRSCYKIEPSRSRVEPGKSNGYYCITFSTSFRFWKIALGSIIPADVDQAWRRRNGSGLEKFRDFLLAGLLLLA